jgi:hypothetical protein
MKQVLQLNFQSGGLMLAILWQSDESTMPTSRHTAMGGESSQHCFRSFLTSYKPNPEVIQSEIKLF